MIFYFLLLSSATQVSMAESDTARSALISHWNRLGVPSLPPPFLLSKTSTLSTSQTIYLTKLASNNSLSTINFCAMANLTCSLKHPSTSPRDFFFGTYHSNYGIDRRFNPTSIRANMVRSGTFFRESQLRQGNVMHFPHIRDKMPPRSFLPRAVVSKLPFSMSRLAVILDIFDTSKNSTMQHEILKTLNDCERYAGPGETKRCLATAEDMVDFAISVMGSSRLMVRTTKINTNRRSSSPTVTIGSVKEMTGSRLTESSLSCHQLSYPYLLYYCHLFPNVRAYEVNIIDVAESAVAICHEDTSAWSPMHASFTVLEHGPGKIEVCHWIYENELVWTVSDY
ncbi:hypothetical protein SAY86_019643 [Trapa natans]|uniref:BURP domain-containing protein n=1 Tax=Trapa natans TaxID=22666 RepID=A0AAN7LP99_TRANT|nr:hypothetical protein SAY86_019643 [Trapa natans]